MVRPGSQGLLRCARSSSVAANEHTAKYFPRRKRVQPLPGSINCRRSVTVSEPPLHFVPFDADMQLKEVILGDRCLEDLDWCTSTRRRQVTISRRFQRPSRIPLISRRLERLHPTTRAARQVAARPFSFSGSVSFPDACRMCRPAGLPRPTFDRPKSLVSVSTGSARLGRAVPGASE